MKFCAQCGTQMEDCARFCQRCGAESIVPQEIPASQAQDGAPQQPTAPQDAPPSCPSAAPQRPPAAQNTPSYNPSSAAWQENGWQEDKVGAAPMVCGVLGLLFALLMPLVGLIFAVIGLVLANSEISSGKTTKTYGRTLNGAVIGLVLIQWAFVLFMVFIVEAG